MPKCPVALSPISRILCYNQAARRTGEVPEWLNGAVSKTVVGLVPTVGSNPTLSADCKMLVAVKAAHYRQPQSFGDLVLTDRGLTTGVISTPEIAQFQLGDPTFNVHPSNVRTP